MNQPERKPRFIDSILVKVGIIAALIVLFLIPSTWIQNLIVEREGYQQEQRASVVSKWADSQMVQGPVLMLPFKKQVADGSGKTTTHDVVNMLYILPQNLQIKATVKTQPYQRGVYDATVYSSDINISGNFSKPDLTAAGIDATAVMYDNARLVFGITDIKGLKNSAVVSLQGQNFMPEPALDNNIPFEKGLQINFPLQKDSGFNFSYQLNLKGSNELYFLHTGKTMDVEVNSDWKSPDFPGRYLPDNKVVSNNGFNAKWHMMYYNRPFPQQWINNDTVLMAKKARENAVFGVKMQLPIDQYRKILRTTKYSTLIILLTFISLFLAEIIKKQRVHVFNYILIGAAMVVYYTLLLSFAEQIGYNLAYLLSSISTIILIAVFTASLLGNKTVAVLFTFILSVFYGFIFIIIQLEELSLLFGSVALFIIVATLMYFSRKVDWNRHGNNTNTAIA